jgi:Cdc6-like AAA superfamily ATPase
MTQQQKTEIVRLLEIYIGQFSSQAAAAASLNKWTSEATIIQMRKNNWDKISDEMWRTVGKHVGWNASTGWTLVETLNFQTLLTLFGDAKDFSNVFAITGEAGTGKSATASWFARHRENVYHISCAEFWNRKMFLSEILRKMGKENTGFNVAEMMEAIVSGLLKQDRPLLILDEADKLSDQVLYFFITLYNMLQGHCGMVLMATDFLQKRIMKGVRNNKKGYNEIISRVGRKFIKLQPAFTKTEIELICKANEVEQPAEIAEIFNGCENDLRRVERLIFKIKQQRLAKKAA